jgi:hypothetical protein
VHYLQNSVCVLAQSSHLFAVLPACRVLLSLPSSTIPHSLYDPSTTPGAEICLFTKDPPQPADYDASLGVPLPNPVKERLQQTPVEGVTKVLPLGKLRKNYAQFAERRRLLSSYALFLADERVLPLLPALLGSKFFEKKRQPVGVNLAQHDIARELKRARDSTYMYLSTGASVSVRISRSTFSRQQSFENIQAALAQIAAHVPLHWKGVQSIHVKTNDSIALPIYSDVSPVGELLADTPATAAAKKGGAAAAAASSKKKQKKPQQPSSQKKAANGAAAAAPATAASSQKKKGQKRALSTKKEDSTAQPPSAKKARAAAAAAPAATAAASTPATPAKAAGAKRPRDAAAASPRQSAQAAPASPAPSAKKAKQAPAAAAPASPAAATPAKPAKKQANGSAVSKSAVKAAATPAPKAASTKKQAPATTKKQ